MRNIKKLLLILILSTFVFSSLISPVSANPLAGRLLAGTVGKQILKGMAEKGGLKVTDDTLNSMTDVINKKALKDNDSRAQSLIDEIHFAEQNLKPTKNSNWKKYVLDPMLWLTGMDIVLEIYNAAKNGEEQEGLTDNDDSSLLPYVYGTSCKLNAELGQSGKFYAFYRYYDSATGTIKTSSYGFSDYKYKNTGDSYCIIRSSWWSSPSVLNFEYEAFAEGYKRGNGKSYFVFTGGHSSYPNSFTYGINKPTFNFNDFIYTPIPRVEESLNNNDPTNLPEKITILVPDDPSDDSFINDPIKEENDPDEIIEDYDPTEQLKDPEQPEEPKPTEPEEEKPVGSSWWKWLFDLLLAPLNLIADLISGLIDLISNLVTSLLDGIKALFIPSDNFFKDFFSGFKDTFDSKLPVVPQLQEFFSAIKDTTVDSKKPTFEVTFPEDWGGGTYSIIDFSFYDEYRAWILNFIRFIAWFIFLKKLYQRIPRMIY